MLRIGSWRLAAAARTIAFARWASIELASGAAGTTRVRFTLETKPATLSDRLMEGLGARSWLKRKNTRAMRRLRSILERSEDRGQRVTMAAG